MKSLQLPPNSSSFAEAGPDLVVPAAGVNEVLDAADRARAAQGYPVGVQIDCIGKLEQITLSSAATRSPSTARSTETTLSGTTATAMPATVRRRRRPSSTPSGPHPSMRQAATYPITRSSCATEWLIGRG
jgi:hypothetical protein